MRLIDADELRLTIQREYNTDDSDYPTHYQFGLHFAMNAIDEAQTVEPQRIKGRWKLLPGRDDEHIRYLHCSVCHFNGDYESNFCPNCGADMRGEEDASSR